jgi:hypothetical protein
MDMLVYGEYRDRHPIGLTHVVGGAYMEIKTPYAQYLNTKGG